MDDDMPEDEIFYETDEDDEDPPPAPQFFHWLRTAQLADADRLRVQKVEDMQRLEVYWDTYIGDIEANITDEVSFQRMHLEDDIVNTIKNHLTWLMDNGSFNAHLKFQLKMTMLFRTPGQSMEICLAGLNDAGQGTILNWLELLPRRGIEVSNACTLITFLNCFIRVFNVENPAEAVIDELNDIIPTSDIIIFMVDITQQERIVLARDALIDLMSRDPQHNVELLVFGNIGDEVDARTVNRLMWSLEGVFLDNAATRCRVRRVCAVTATGLYESLSVVMKKMLVEANDPMLRSRSSFERMRSQFGPSTAEEAIILVDEITTNLEELLLDNLLTEGQHRDMIDKINDNLIIGFAGRDFMNDKRAKFDFNAYVTKIFKDIRRIVG